MWCWWREWGECAWMVNVCRRHLRIGGPLGLGRMRFRITSGSNLPHSSATMGVDSIDTGKTNDAFSLQQWISLTFYFNSNVSFQQWLLSITMICPRNSNWIASWLSNLWRKMLASYNLNLTRCYWRVDLLGCVAKHQSKTEANPLLNSSLPQR